MQSNSDGLSPSLKPFLGIGHGRALPSSFGFDNGYQGDGVNDYFTIPNMIGKSFPNDICFEFWLSAFAYTSANYIMFQNSVTGQKINIDGYNRQVQTANYGNTGVNSIIDGVRYLVNINYGSSIESYLDTLIRHTTLNPNFVPGLVFDQTKLFNIASKFDEFKIYNRKLTYAEIRLNYNNGIGSNPCVTENLLVWYKFQEFEMLDFSPLQDNSDIKLGIRDHSGKHNHAQPFNMDTNPASPTYVLKPF